MWRNFPRAFLHPFFVAVLKCFLPAENCSQQKHYFILLSGNVSICNSVSVKRKAVDILRKTQKTSFLVLCLLLGINMLKNAFEHLEAIHKRLTNDQGTITLMGVNWIYAFDEVQDWPWSAMALKPSSKFLQSGKKMNEQTKPGVMYAMLNFQLDDEEMFMAGMVTEMRLCISYDDVREDRAGNEPLHFFVPKPCFKDYMDLNNCKYCSHCLLLPIESPEERLKLVSDKEWFNSFEKLTKFDGVEVFHEDSWHPARLRYEGGLSVLDRPEGPEGVIQPRYDEVDGGTFFGVELLRGSVSKGNTDGVHYGQERTGAMTEKENGYPDRQFSCEANCGLFVTASKIRPKPDLLTEEEKKVGEEIALREQEEECRERKARQEEWKASTEGKTPEEIRAMKRLVTTEYGKVVNHKPIAEEVDLDIDAFVYNEQWLLMFRLGQTMKKAGIFKGSGIEEEGPDYLIEEFRAVRKQFHKRQNAKIKKYHQNLERESDDEEEKEEEEDDIDGDDDDDDDDRSDQETQYVCENCKCDRSHKEKDI